MITLGYCWSNSNHSEIYVNNSSANGLVPLPELMSIREFWHQFLQFRRKFTRYVYQNYDLKLRFEIFLSNYHGKWQCLHRFLQIVRHFLKKKGIIWLKGHITFGLALCVTWSVPVIHGKPIESEKLPIHILVNWLIFDWIRIMCGGDSFISHSSSSHFCKRTQS